MRKNSFTIKVQSEPKNEIGPGQPLFFLKDGRVKIEKNDIIELTAPAGDENTFLVMKAIVRDVAGKFVQCITDTRMNSVFVDRTEFNSATIIGNVGRS